MRLIPDGLWAILTVYGEARGEPDDGKLGVAEVIRNRMRLTKRTAAQIVLEAAQFSCWNAGDPNRRAMAALDDEDPEGRQCAAAWALAENGSDTVRGATNYLNEAAVRALTGGTLPSWAADPQDPTRVDARKVTARVGAHTFLRLP